MTVQEIIAKYGANEEIDLVFALLYLFASRDSVDPAELDTILDLVKQRYGEPFALNFVDFVSTAEDITMFTDRLNWAVNDSTVPSELVALIMSIGNTSVNDAVSHTEVVTINKV